MIQPERPYQQYCNLHTDFITEYKIISARVAELYKMPKRFIEENAVEMDRYMVESSMPGSPDNVNPAHSGVREFIYRIEDFKLQIMGLFFEHRMLIEKCTEYMQKVQLLKMESNDAYMEEKLVELIPELTTLRFKLKCIEEKATGMLSRLESVEGKWNAINGRVAA
ncbi:MAG TPA: hypothetical protein VK154_07860 [Chitinophagales bacterium]|nr:hypothetical protein [Chitinophagales bacterium]